MNAIVTRRRNGPAAIVKNNCAECPFNTRTITTRGNPESQLVIVGESPGSTEIRMGVPFVGPSGQFLEQMFERVGVKEEPFYTNAFSCLPPRGEKDKKDQLINDACRACSSRLISEISAHPRKLIVAMGTAALRALTGNYSAYITKDRGALLSTNLSSVGILPCFHPAHVLRNEGLFPQSLADMEKIPMLLYSKNIPSNPRYEYKIISTDADLKAFARKCNKAGEVAADIETTGLDRFNDEFTCIGISTLPLVSHRSKQRVTTYVIEGLENFKKFLSHVSKKVEWTWHNGKFDCTFLWAQDKSITKERIRVDSDTMLMSYALDENGGRHGLERCIMDWLGVPGYKDMLDDFTKIGSDIHKAAKAVVKKKDSGFKTIEAALKHFTWELTTKIPGITEDMREQYARTGYNKKAFGLVPKPILYDYLAKDVTYTGWLKAKLQPLIDEDEFLNTLYWDMLVPASNALGTVELNGLPIDQDVVKQSETELNARIEPVLAELRRLSGSPTFNPNSQPQVMAALTDGNEEKGIKGRGLQLRKSDADALTAFGSDISENGTVTSHGDEFVDALGEYRKLNKLYGTYIKPYIPGHGKSIAGLESGRINTSYLIHGTVTGRLSSSGPNVQNIPKLKIIRRIVKAPKGRIFVSLDYSQAELRSLAVLSGDQGLLDIFRSGQDLHTAVAAKVFGTDFTELDKSDEKQSFRWKEIRRYAKTINFGVVYGVTAPTLAERLGISKELAVELINDWFAGFPIAKQFIQDTRQVREQTLVTVFGRKRRFHILTEQNQYGMANESGNFLHQSMCSDFTLEACILMHTGFQGVRDRAKSDLITLSDLPGNVKQINIIHDDNMFEIDRNKHAVITLIENASKVMQGVPVSMGVDTIPFTADASIGTDWASLKDIRMDLLAKNKLVIAQDD